MAQNYDKTPLSYTNGFVARPELKDTPKGEVFTFGLGRAESYDDGADVKWLSVEVWNPGLIAAIKDEVVKGTKVAVEGYLVKREVGDKVYTSLRATRVGRIEFFKKADATDAPAAKKPVVKKASPVAASDPDDLGV